MRIVIEIDDAGRVGAEGEQPAVDRGRARRGCRRGARRGEAVTPGAPGSRRRRRRRRRGCAPAARCAPPDPRGGDGDDGTMATVPSTPAGRPATDAHAPDVPGRGGPRRR